MTDDIYSVENLTIRDFWTFFVQNSESPAMFGGRWIWELLHNLTDGAWRWCDPTDITISTCMSKYINNVVTGILNRSWWWIAELLKSWLTFYVRVMCRPFTGFSGGELTWLGTMFVFQVCDKFSWLLISFFINHQILMIKFCFLNFLVILVLTIYKKKRLVEAWDCCASF